MKSNLLFFFLGLGLLNSTNAQTSAMGKGTTVNSSHSYGWISGNINLRLYSPPGSGTKSLPLVIALHGNASNMGFMENRGLNAAADVFLFRILYVEGMTNLPGGSKGHWIAPGQTAFTPFQNVNATTGVPSTASTTSYLLNDLLDKWLKNKFPAFSNHRITNDIFLTGFSGGAIYTLWCATETNVNQNPLRTRIKSFAAVEGAGLTHFLNNNVPAIANNQRKPVLLINGTGSQSTNGNMIGYPEFRDSKETFMQLIRRNTGSPVGLGNIGNMYPFYLNASATDGAYTSLWEWFKPMTNTNRVQYLECGNMDHYWPGLEPANNLLTSGPIVSNDFSASYVVCYFFLHKQIPQVLNMQWFKANQPLKQNPVAAGDTDTNFDFTVYPNPTQNNITIAINKSLPQPLHLRIFDVTGKVILVQENNTWSKNVLELNTESLKEGVYFLEVYNNTLSRTIRFMKI